MKLTLRFDIGEGPCTVSTTLAVIVAWERKYRKKAGDLATGIGMEDLAFMAWDACKRKKIVVPVELDTFIERLIELEVVTEEEATPFSVAPTDAH